MVVSRRILEFLLVALILLKATGLTTMSWWWVFSPMWLPAVFVAGFLGFSILIGGKISITRKNKNESKD